MSDKLCFRCGSNKTRINKSKKGKPYLNWNHDKDGNVICHKCYCRQFYYDNREYYNSRRKQWYRDNHEHELQYQKQWYRDNREYALLCSKITRPRQNQLRRDRYRLKHGLWIP